MDNQNYKTKINTVEELLTAYQTGERLFTLATSRQKNP